MRLRGKFHSWIGVIANLCDIISCVVAIYGVLQVVNFVIEVRPLVVPLSTEVRNGNVDIHSLLSRENIVVHTETIKVASKDTIIQLPPNRPGKKTEPENPDQGTGSAMPKQPQPGGAVPPEEAEKIKEREKGFRERHKRNLFH